MWSKYYAVIPSTFTPHTYLLRRFEGQPDKFMEMEVNVKRKSVKANTIYPLTDDTRKKYLKIVQDFVKKGEPIGITYIELPNDKLKANKAFSALQ